MKQLNYFVINRIETGNRIRGYREKLHLSQDGLADILADEGVVVSTNSIGRWERGEVDISYEYAKALQCIFGCEFYDGLIIGRLRHPEDERDQPVHLYGLIREKRIHVNTWFRFFCILAIYVRFLVATFKCAQSMMTRWYDMMISKEKCILSVALFQDMILLKSRHGSNMNVVYGKQGRRSR